MEKQTTLGYMGYYDCPFCWIMGVFLTTLEYTTQPMQSPVMFFPLPIFLFIGLYWVRKWATQPSRLDNTVTK